MQICLVAHAYLPLTCSHTNVLARDIGSNRYGTGVDPVDARNLVLKNSKQGFGVAEPVTEPVTEPVIEPSDKA